MSVVSIADVAVHAGLSAMSVSRVLNDSPSVSTATRERVLRAIAELGYMPSAPARSLARGRTQLLGVLIPSTNNPIYGLYVDGIRDAARQAGYSVVLSKPAGDVDSAKETDARLLSEQRAAGVIITYAGWHEQVFWLMRRGVQVVCIDHRVPGCDRITLDNPDAMRQAVVHLVRLGHRAIGVITGPIHVASERERLVGYRRAMREHGLALERPLQVIAPEFTDECGYAMARDALTRAGRPSALIVGSSTLIAGVLLATVEMGMQVPNDLALVGLGELSWSRALISPITSIVEPAYQMGFEACRLLLSRLDGSERGPAQTRSYPAHVAIRLSCGAPLDSRDVPMRSPYSLLFNAVASPAQR